MKIPTISLLLAGASLAQVYTPPPAMSNAAQPGTSMESSSSHSKQSAKSPYGDTIPMLDPTSGSESITIGGVTIPLGDNRILRARFEKYLSQPAETDGGAAEYRALIAEILATVSPYRTGGPDIYGAFKKLPSAATYPGDSNICTTLAESVYMAMLSKKDVKGVGTLNKTMTEEKERLARLNDWEARRSSKNGLLSPGAGTGGKGNQPQPAPAPANSGTGTAAQTYIMNTKRIAEIDAMQKANGLRTATQVLQSKGQYQVNLVQWFMQRRYEHVVMGARFYNQIWKDGDTGLQIKENSEISKLFTKSLGVSPTVSSLDSLSNEMIGEVTKYMGAIDMMITRNELHSASQRLLEAYAIGEYLAPVATFEMGKKQRIAEYTRDLSELSGALQAHDFVRGKVLCSQLKGAAKDFPSSKVDSYIAAYTLQSDLAVEEAKSQMLLKNSAAVGEKIKEATEAWPTNPKLEEFRNAVSSSGGLVQVRNDFDRLLSEKNFREISKRMYEIAPAIRGDAAREDAFKQIITNLTKIETALGKAAEFSKMNQNYAAWEQLATLRNDFPDDPKLGRELELLSSKVADFTKALDQAGQLEKRTPAQTGSSLAWYLKAKGIYPTSDMAKAGIDRQLKAIQEK